MRLYPFTALWVLPDGTEQTERFEAQGREEAERYVEQRMERSAREKATTVGKRRVLWCKDLRLADEPAGSGYALTFQQMRARDQGEGFEDDF